MPRPRPGGVRRGCGGAWRGVTAGGGVAGMRRLRGDVAAIWNNGDRPADRLPALGLRRPQLVRSGGHRGPWALGDGRPDGGDGGWASLASDAVAGLAPRARDGEG